jgi:hypothetical protein
MTRIFVVIGIMFLGVMITKEVAKKAPVSTALTQQQYGLLESMTFGGIPTDTPRIIGKHPFFVDLSVVSLVPLVHISMSLQCPELGLESTKRVG